MPPKRNVSIQTVTPTDDISFANKEKYYDEIFTEISRNCGSEFLAHLQTEDELLKRNLINREFHRKGKKGILEEVEERRDGCFNRLHVCSSIPDYSLGINYLPYIRKKPDSPLRIFCLYLLHLYHDILSVSK